MRGLTGRRIGVATSAGGTGAGTAAGATVVIGDIYEDAPTASATRSR
ncbi:hypothetical protein [Streptomyces sp. NBC_01451]|nr:hypothetical protein [Streptomyces sp. NBC_01451]